jgi:cytochrome c oxidase assembly protein subunit 15
MPSFRRLAITSTVMTFLLVAIGGAVRATDSGLGCGTDWPHCHGELIPVLNARPIIIEWSHRAVAVALGLVVLVMVVQAWREHRDRPSLVRWSAGALVLVAFQGMLGRAVVKEELEALLVVGHLATAMLFAAVLIVIWTAANRAEGRSPDMLDRATSRLASFGAWSVYALLLVGSYTSDFGYVPGWPFMYGRIVPNPLDERNAVHYLHRILAVLVAIVVVYVATTVIRRSSELPVASRLARAAVGLYAIELFIGAMNVWTELNPVVVTFHLTIGALAWGCLIGTAVVTSQIPSRIASIREGAARPAALETSR